VIAGEMPETLQKSAELYAGCIGGALKQDDYLNIIKHAGFKNIEIKKSKTIGLPDEAIAKLGVSKEVKEFRNNGGGIFSITVVGTKS
jgi:hypothetical protein